MTPLQRLALGIKHLARPVLYRFPPVALEPERQLLWLSTLLATVGAPGGVVEVGCAAGGTTALSCRMLRRLGDQRDYTCIDTFQGFDGEQFAIDRSAGTPGSHRHAFTVSSKRLVERTLRGLGVEGVRLEQGNVSDIADDAFPRQISAGLIDVDLSVPTFDALDRMHPRLAPRGVILVDDCDAGSSWRARTGYLEFVAKVGLAPRFVAGMGIVLGSGIGIDELAAPTALAHLSE